MPPLSHPPTIRGHPPNSGRGFKRGCAWTALAAGWWWLADRRALGGAYALLLLGTLFAAYLTYLELFVIEAVCIWCASFAITIVAGLVVAAMAQRGAAAPPGLGGA